VLYALRQPMTTLPTTGVDETDLVEALRRRDEAAFVTLVERYHASLVRLAQLYVPDRAAAEEVVQDTWLGVLKGIDRFEGRSSLKTWLFRILTNTAKTRGVREARSVPFSVLFDTESESIEPAVAADRFASPDEQWAGSWSIAPSVWTDQPEARLLSRETLAHIRSAIDALPLAQREVIILRDIEGWSSGEVCNALDITETNQRVLLHRARSKVRAALEDYLANH
jgi:RNA polymerase sigma-70 factor (ECF subfamily)